MQYAEYQSMESLPIQCRKLIKEASSTNLYLSEAWFANIVEKGLEENANLHIITVEDTKAEKCFALLMLRSSAGQNGSRFSDWHMQANTLASLTNFQSSYFSLLFDTESVSLDKVCQILVTGLSLSRSKWHLVDLNLLEPRSPEYSCLQAAFSESGYICKNYMYKGNWFERMEYADFDEYLKSRDKSSKKSIQNYQRKFRKLEKENRIRIQMYSGNACLDTVLATYDEIYLSSWKDDDFFPDFYHGLIRQCVANGSLRIAFVYLDEKPVAFEFAVVTGSQCVMMRTAYISEFSRESVGAMAILTMIQYVIDKDNVKEIDFGTDDDQYKSTWVKQRRERHGLVSFNKKTVSGRYYCLRYMIYEWIESLKNQIRKAVSKAPARDG